MVPAGRICVGFGGAADGTLYGYQVESYHGTIRYNNLILKNGDFQLDRHEVVLK